MSDRPILFSAPMVRAILAGDKTQTRRILKPQPELLSTGLYHVYNRHGGLVGVEESDVGTAGVDFLRIEIGDRLWVREAWAPLDAHVGNDPGVQALADRGFYRADGSTVDGEISKWRPSIHMPRWASRLTLTVTDVRVQRLQEISEEDAKAEGIAELRPPDRDGCRHFGVAPFPRDRPTAGLAFAMLWEAINGEGSWGANPWVAAYTFTVELKNIDA